MSSPRRAENLLDQVAETALDDDYYLVRSVERDRSMLDVVAWGVVLVLIAVVITVAAVQSRSTRPSSTLEQQALARDVDQKQKTLVSRRTAVEALRDQVAALREPDVGAQKAAAHRLVTGAVGASGPGLVVDASDSSAGNADGRVTARDLRLLVDGLWSAGAEAIAVNGHRIGALSAVMPLQGGITVDYQRIAPPYRVVAIGDDEELARTFREGPFGQYWSTRERRAGLRWSMTGSSELSVPAAAERRTTISIAKPVEEDR